MNFILFFRWAHFLFLTYFYFLCPYFYNNESTHAVDNLLEEGLPLPTELGFNHHRILYYIYILKCFFFNFIFYLDNFICFLNHF